MIRSEWHRLRGSVRLATAMFLGFSALLVCGICAQSTVPAVSGSSQSVTASSSFLVAPSFSLGYAPSSVATGDLRQAGKLDLVTADYNSGKMTVFLGAGQGSFASGVVYAAGPHPSFVAVADINGDGKPDVLVANETEGTISVLLGNGDGTLQALQSYAAGGNPSFLVTGDFSGRRAVRKPACRITQRRQRQPAKTHFVFVAQDAGCSCGGGLQQRRQCRSGPGKRGWDREHPARSGRRRVSSAS